jgi:hypothetical protein
MNVLSPKTIESPSFRRTAVSMELTVSPLMKVGFVVDKCTREHCRKRSCVNIAKEETKQFVLY